jgi:hypothetical protein
VCDRTEQRARRASEKKRIGATTKAQNIISAKKNLTIGEEHWIGRFAPFFAKKTPKKNGPTPQISGRNGLLINIAFWRQLGWQARKN